MKDLLGWLAGQIGLAKLPTEKTITSAELRQHATRTSAWLALQSDVYDLTQFLELHPGGAHTILACCGTQAH